MIFQIVILNEVKDLFLLAILNHLSRFAILPLTFPSVTRITALRTRDDDNKPS